MLKSQSDLNQIICNILNINYHDYDNLISKRKMGAVKAAVRLGADSNIAQIFAPLKLAMTSEEIIKAYSTPVRSCMSNDITVGDFYSTNQIYCIWSECFRVLYNPKTNIILDSSYGFHRDIVMKELSKQITVSEDNFLPIFSKEIIEKVSVTTAILSFAVPKISNIPFRIIIQVKGKKKHLLNISKELSMKIFEVLDKYRNVCDFEKDLYFDDAYVNIFRYRCELPIRIPMPFRSKVKRFVYEKLVIKDSESMPFLDFSYGTYDFAVDNNHLETFQDEIEYSVLSKFGETYRDPMHKSRTNYDSKYMRKKNVI